MKSRPASAAAMSNTPATGVTLSQGELERSGARQWRSARAESEIRPATSTTDDLAASAHETIDRVSESAIRTEQQLRKNVGSAKARLREFSDEALNAADEQVAEVKSFVEKKPLQGAGIALLAGFVLSRILR